MMFNVYVRGMLLCAFFYLSAHVYGQSKVKVQGVVKSASGQLLSDVSVKIKDTNEGTKTDQKGAYTIVFPKEKF